MNSRSFQLGVRLMTVGFAGLLAACGAREARSPEASCEQGAEVGVALGFERAKVGENELPIAIFCGMQGDRPAPRASRVDVSFTPPSAAAETPAIKGEVQHRPGARALEAGSERMQFDYVVRVMFDRAGTWAMHLRTQVPWRTQESSTSMSVVVDPPDKKP